MRLPQLGIGGLMVLAAVVAADVAAGRAVVSQSEYFGSAPDWLAATMPVAIALQCIVLSLRAGHARARIFWIGVLVFGIAGLASVVWHLSDPPTETVTFSTSGTSREIDPGSPASRLWEPYLNAVCAGLDLFGLLPAPNNHWMSTAQVALTFFFPQLLVALAAGLIAQTLAKRLIPMWDARQVRSPGETNGADDRQFLQSETPSETRSPKITGRKAWLIQVASVIAVFLIAMIASGTPGLFGKAKNDMKAGPVELPKLAPIIDDLKFFTPPARSD